MSDNTDEESHMYHYDGIAWHAERGHSDYAVESIKIKLLLILSDLRENKFTTDEALSEIVQTIPINEFVELQRRYKKPQSKLVESYPKVKV